jgi:hypothetical protein
MTFATSLARDGEVFQRGVGPRKCPAKEKPDPSVNGGCTVVPAAFLRAGETTSTGVVITGLQTRAML